MVRVSHIWVTEPINRSPVIIEAGNYYLLIATVRVTFNYELFEGDISDVIRKKFRDPDLTIHFHSISNIKW